MRIEKFIALRRPANTYAQALLVSTAIAAGLVSVPAYAAGTAAGTTITNDVSVAYEVNSTPQTAVASSAVVTVDRKVDLTVVREDSAAIVVSSLQQRAVTTFRLRNLSNDTLDVVLDATQLAGGTSAFGGTDNFDVTNVAVFEDTNGNTAYDAGTDAQVTFVDEVLPDTERLLFVVADVPNSRTTGDVATVRLTGTAHLGGAAGQGALLEQTNGANTTGIDTVFADGSGSGDAARDGKFAAIHDYRVSTATLTVTKTSKVISDPFNLLVDPKIIPQAIVEYCVAVSNSGGATASNLTITSDIGAGLVYLENSIRLNGTVNGSGVCAEDGTAGGTHVSGTVSGPLAPIGPGQSATFVYRAEVQ